MMKYLYETKLVISTIKTLFTAWLSIVTKYTQGTASQALKCVS